LSSLKKKGRATIFIFALSDGINTRHLKFPTDLSSLKTLAGYNSSTKKTRSLLLIAETAFWNKSYNEKQETNFTKKHNDKVLKNTYF
jgi:hypothetical protein